MRRRPDPLFAERAEETVGWLMREMPPRVTAGRLRRLPGRRQRGRGRQILRLDRGRGRRPARPRCRRFPPRLRRDAGAAIGKATPFSTPPCTPRGCRSRGSHPRPLPRHAVRGPRAAHPARPRRQGAGRLERPDDRRPGPRRRRLRPARLARPRARRAFAFVADHGRPRTAACTTPGAIGRVTAPPACSTTTPPWPAPRWPCSRRPARPRYLGRRSPGPRPSAPISPTPDGGYFTSRRRCRPMCWSAAAPPATTPPPPATASWPRSRPGSTT